MENIIEKMIILATKIYLILFYSLKSIRIVLFKLFSQFTDIFSSRPQNFSHPSINFYTVHGFITTFLLVPFSVKMCLPLIYKRTIFKILLNIFFRLIQYPLRNGLFRFFIRL